MFTHLQVRSGYSFFNSTITIEKLVKRAKELEFKAIALTDEEVLYGVIPFYKQCSASGIKPIIGMVVNIPYGDEFIPTILLAKNNNGYKNLLKISTQKQLEGTFTESFLKNVSSDLVCIVPTENVKLKQMLIQNQFQQLDKLIHHFLKFFVQEDVYVGIEIYERNHGQLLLELAKQFENEYGYRFVALQDVRYLEEKDALSYECLQAMKFHEKWDPLTKKVRHINQYLRSDREMREVFSDWQNLIDRTEEIADKCNVHFEFDRRLLPSFPVPTNETSSEYLRRLCEEQLPLKYKPVTDEVKARLAYELEVIEKLGFSDYFLIVADFVQYAKEQDIVVGPGRGSAAGSIVSYLLGITSVDPLEYDLLFERFLNPERVTMPDIDIDFSDTRRDEVIEYVRNKYGQDHVAQIITFGTFAARSLLRELMKTMDINDHDQAYVLKHIPVQADKPIQHYVQSSKEFESYIKQSKPLTMLFFIAMKLEGLPRHISTHAAGIVIGKDPLLNEVPLTKGTHDTYLTQFAMNDLEAIGLLKIDILGLRNLSIMERIVQMIYEREGRSININNIPMDDPKTFALLRAGKTNGIFQLESSGMKNVLVNLKPTSLDDIIALNALYRPGPMEQIPTYIKRKHRKEKVTYVHPDLEPILNKTYGVLVYQEQIMQVAHHFAGLSLGEADILRRAVSKKDRRLIEAQRDTFIRGCLKKGYDLEIAEEIFSWILKFSNYGFNKSHSVAYSIIAYQLSYLKANFPTYFFAQLLGSAINDGSKMNMYVREANDLGIEILPPSINHSYAYFTVEGKHIRVGLMAIKGIGYETVKTIIDARKNKPFRDLFDFCLRVSIKRNALETLILAGAFDETYDNRASLLASIDQALDRAELFGGAQSNLFQDELNMRPAYVEIADFTPIQKLRDEKELLDMYVSSHPLKQHRTRLTIEKFLTLQRAKSLTPRTKIKVVAIVEKFKRIHTKRGDSMAFVTLSDETDEMEAVVFPDVFREVNQWLKEEIVISIEGRISVRNNRKQLVIDSLQDIDLENLSHRYIFIRLTEANLQNANDNLRSIAQRYPGQMKIIIYNELEKKTYKLGQDFMINGHNESIELLQKYFGKENVVVK